VTVYLTRDFTAPDGDPWPGFTRIAGAALAEAVIGNRGGAGISAAERLYQPTAWLGVASYIARVNERWANATTQGREVGLGVRVNDSGSDGYWVDVRSVIGLSPQARLRRRNGNAWTDLAAWADIAATPAAVEAGVDVELHVRTEAAGVVLSVIVDGVAEIDHTDASASQIGSGGTVALRLGGACTGSDVTFDDLTAEDFASEAPPGALTTGVVLVLGGEYLDSDAWAARGISLGVARDSYDDSPAIEIRDLELFNEPALVSGLDVSVLIGGVTVAAGKLRQTTHNAVSDGEGNSYTVNSPAQLASELPIVHPKTKAPEIVYNVKPDHAQFDPERAAMSARSSPTCWTTTRTGRTAGAPMARWRPTARCTCKRNSTRWTLTSAACRPRNRRCCPWRRCSLSCRNMRGASTPKRGCGSSTTGPTRPWR